ncbi:hypothetical protein D4R75_15155 [bacterium]|nr:MAG: hypothetical protein D4R75_15155 [bacterium]
MESSQKNRKRYTGFLVAIPPRGCYIDHRLQRLVDLLFTTVSISGRIRKLACATDPEVLFVSNGRDRRAEVRLLTPPIDCERMDNSTKSWTHYTEKL